MSNCFYFLSLTAACGIFFPRPRIKTAPPIVEACSLNDGTTREVPPSNWFAQRQRASLGLKSEVSQITVYGIFLPYNATSSSFQIYVFLPHSLCLHFILTVAHEALSRNAWNSQLESSNPTPRHLPKREKTYAFKMTWTWFFFFASLFIIIKN